MASKGGGGGVLVVIGVLAGLALLHYTQTGRGKENNAPLLPDRFEGWIDNIVGELNKRFGHRWVTLGLNFLQARLANVLPPQAVLVLNAVYAAEQQAGWNMLLPLSGAQKKQVAIGLLRKQLR